MIESIFPSLNAFEANLRLLASPLVVLTRLPMIVLVLASLLYFVGQKRLALYWKKFGLVADLMSIVGLIGLSVFAGRTLLDEDLRAARAAEQLAHGQLQNTLAGATMAICLPLSRDKSPTHKVADAIEFCNAVKDGFGDIDWDSRYKQLLSFPQSNGYAFAAQKIGELAKIFMDARRRVSQAEMALTFTTQLTSTRLSLVVC